MSIWFNKELSIEKFSKVGQKTMGDFLGIEWVEIGDDFIKARMPVDERTKQPYGLLHGGASCVLAETIGSIASAMVIDTAQFQCCLLYTSPSPRDRTRSRMPSSA